MVCSPRVVARQSVCETKPGEDQILPAKAREQPWPIVRRFPRDRGPDLVREEGTSDDAPVGPHTGCQRPPIAE